MNRLIGLDVSNNNGYIDWRAVADCGRSFAFVKATEDKAPINNGHGYRDPFYAANVEQARSYGIRTAPYVYAHPDHCSPADSITLLQEVAGVIGDVQNVLLYSSPYFLEKYNLLGQGVADQCLLWLASWTKYTPGAIGAWDGPTFWQFRADGNVPGVTGQCDEDVFLGSLAYLEALGPLVALDVEEGEGDFAQWVAEWADLVKRVM